MENKINYSFTPIPFVLGTYMDHYCYYMLGKLLGLAFTNQSNTFKTNNQNLQIITGLSKRVINATLSSLHRNGIITVECVGQSVSKTSNTITINTSKFEEYDKMGVCTAYTDTDKLISIDKYDVKGYKVSYLQDNEEKEEISTGLPTTEDNDFVATITSAETITDSDVDDIYQKENVSVAPATATPPAEIEPVKVEYNSIAIPKNNEGWFDLLNTLKYKIIDTDDPNNFLSKNYGLIEKLCSVYGFKNPQMTYSDSKPMYEYCMNKNYI